MTWYLWFERLSSVVEYSRTICHFFSLFWALFLAINLFCIGVFLQWNFEQFALCNSYLFTSLDLVIGPVDCISRFDLCVLSTSDWASHLLIQWLDLFGFGYLNNDWTSHSFKVFSNIGESFRVIVPALWLISCDKSICLVSILWAYDCESIDLVIETLWDTTICLLPKSKDCDCAFTYPLIGNWSWLIKLSIWDGDWISLGWILSHK